MNDSSSTTENKPLRVLISGRAGSGKSSVCQELVRRGFAAFDTDKVPGLAHWFDLRSGTETSLNGEQYVDLSRYEWRWSRTVLQQLFENPTSVFVCGGADNDFDFEDLLTHHFILDVSPETQVFRLTHRTGNAYGKDLAMHTAIIEKAVAHTQQAKEMGLIIIDADRPLRHVVDAILEQLK